MVSLIYINKDVLNMWLENLTDSSYIPNSTMDSLVIDRVVTLDLNNMGILCLIIAIISSFIIYITIKYLKNNK
jgi:hypothetical protein